VQKKQNKTININTAIENASIMIIMIIPRLSMIVSKPGSDAVAVYVCRLHKMMVNAYSLEEVLTERHAVPIPQPQIFMPWCNHCMAPESPSLS
jgi:hypothetical protein